MHKTILLAVIILLGAAPAGAQAHCCWSAPQSYYIEAPFVEDLPADEVAPNVYVVYEPPGPRRYPYVTSRFTRGAHWHAQAQTVFDWFLGRNDLGVSLVDPVTGACYDGLQPDWVNQNQGAESALAFLLALLELRATEAELLAEEAAREAERLMLANGMSAHA